MSRSPTASIINALGAAHLEQVVFVELQFASGTARVCTREHTISWNGESWLGAGRVGQIDGIQEGVQLQARSLRMTLSSIPLEMMTIALNPPEYKNRLLRLWFGLLDTSSPAAHSVISDPVGPFLYRMDSLDFELGEVGMVTLTANSRLEDWQRPRVRRYNNADQQDEYPGDRFFEYAEQMVQKDFLW